MAGAMEPEGRDAAGKPLLVRVSGSSGGDSHGSAASSSIAVVVGSTAVAVAGSFEFGLSVSPASVRDGFLLPFFTFFLTKIDV
jgi:SP family facilitated glucose transporter-like MFS transporter 8